MSTAAISFDASDLANAELALAQAPERLARALYAAMDATVDGLVYEVSERTPKTTGELAKDILGATHMDGPLGVVGVVGSASPYVEWVELGTKPHPVSLKGQDALAIWAMNKFAVSEKEARSIGFLVARKIRRQGTKGAFMLRDALAASEPRIRANFAEALQRAVAGIGK